MVYGLCPGCGSAPTSVGNTHEAEWFVCEPCAVKWESGTPWFRWETGDFEDNERQLAQYRDGAVHRGGDDEHDDPVSSD